MNNIRTETTKELINSLEKTYNLFNNAQGLHSQGELDKIGESLKVRVREFSSKLYFLAVFGPLKSGKSTLSNCLSGDFVSPTGFGIETTIRPSIIVKGEHDVIYEFLRLNSNDDDNVLFNTVIDFLRKTCSKEELQRYVTIKETPLSNLTPAAKKNVIKQKVTEGLDQEPLITVISVREGNLINDEIALIDMPGLDGQQCNFEKHPVYKWIIERSDFYVFVLSSMAAINDHTAKFFEEILKRNTRPPLWLVQNIFEAKPWQSEQEQTDDVNTQKSHIKKQIENSFQLLPDATKTLNLGKAEDAILKKVEQLLNDSNFDQFKDELKTHLETTRKIQFEIQCIQKAGDVVESSIFALKKISEEIQGQNKDYNSKVSHLEKTSNECGQKISIEATKPPSAEVRTYVHVIDDEKRRFSSLIKGKFETEFTNVTKISASNLQTKFDRVYSQLKGESTMFDIGSIFGRDLSNVINSFYQNIENKYLESVNNCLKELELEFIFLDPTNLELPKFNALDISQKRVPTVPKLFRWFDKKTEEITQLRTEYITDVERALESKVMEYSRIITAISQKVHTTRMAKLQDLATQRIQSYKEKHSEKNSKLEATKIFIEKAIKGEGQLSTIHEQMVPRSLKSIKTMN